MRPFFAPCPDFRGAISRQGKVTNLFVIKWSLWPNSKIQSGNTLAPLHDPEVPRQEQYFRFLKLRATQSTKL